MNLKNTYSSRQRRPPLHPFLHREKVNSAEAGEGILTILVALALGGLWLCMKIEIELMSNKKLTYVDLETYLNNEFLAAECVFIRSVRARTAI